MQQPSRPTASRDRLFRCVTGSLLVCLASGPIAVLSTFVAPLIVGQPFFLVGAAAVEEFAKPLAVIFLIERRSKIIYHSGQVIFLALVGAAAFSIVENIIYIHVYFPAPEHDLVTLRWTVCTPLHIGATAIFALGLRRLWLSMRAGQMFEPEPFLPYYAIAVAVHAAYNIFAMAAAYATEPS